MQPFTMEAQSPDELQKHITGTYTTLRLGVAVIGIALPLLLWIGGLIVLDVPLRDSMSAYYHTGMRNVLVGLLFATGACLYLYKGFSDQENVALNCAGIFAVCVAMFPPGLPGGPTRLLTAHSAAGALFFLAVAYVCLFRAPDTLTLMRDAERARSYRRAYRLIGTGMVLSPVIAWVLTQFLRGGDGNPYTFFIELAGTWIFGAYWLVKSREIAHTDAERRAAERAVYTHSTGNVVAVSDAQEPATSPLAGRP